MGESVTARPLGKDHKWKRSYSVTFQKKHNTTQHNKVLCSTFASFSCGPKTHVAARSTWGPARSWPWHLTFLLNRRPERLTQSRASVIGPAASSYNNIALWRSPERTGKCCLCAPAGWTGWWWGGLFVQPQQQPTLGERRAGQGGARQWWDVGRGGVQKGRGTPACATFGVNKVWKSTWRDRKCYWTYHKLLFINGFLKRVTDVSHAEQRWQSFDRTRRPSCSEARAVTLRKCFLCLKSRYGR